MAVDSSTMYAVVAGSIVLIIVIVTLISKFTSHSSKDDKKEGKKSAAPLKPQPAVVGPSGARIRGNRTRNRMRPVADDSNDDEEEEDVDAATETGKVGAKKLKKLQEKAERKTMREQEEQSREERKKKEKESELERKIQEEIEKKEAAIREEAERKIKEEQEQREHEEYLKMKEMFSVDEEGEGEQDADLNSESLLEQFIKYIKETKVVMLEDLAGHFKLKTQDVIHRVQDLQAEGRLTGVIDDRGKFIYITMEELEAVAHYIRQCGRVSIADLAASSNRLINLDPDTSSTALKMASQVVDTVTFDEIAA